MDQKKKNMILIGVVAVLLVGALLLGFRETIFGAAPPVTSAVVEDAKKQSEQVAEPPPVEPQTSPFSKTPKKVGG